MDSYPFHLFFFLKREIAALHTADFPSVGVAYWNRSRPGNRHGAGETYPAARFYMSVGVFRRAFSGLRRIVAAVLSTPGARGTGGDFPLGSQLWLADQLRSTWTRHITVASPVESADSIRLFGSRIHRVHAL